MNYIGVKIVVIALAFLFYWFVIRKLSKNLRRGSRVEMFSVGGRKQRDKEELEQMSREERLRRRKVSLRDGSLFRRRFK